MVEPHGLQVGFERNVYPGSRAGERTLASEQPHRPVVTWTELLEWSARVVKQNRPHHSRRVPLSSSQKERFQEAASVVCELPGQSPIGLPWGPPCAPGVQTSVASGESTPWGTPMSPTNPEITFLLQTCECLPCPRGRFQKRRLSPPPWLPLPSPPLSKTVIFQGTGFLDSFTQLFPPRPERVSPAMTTLFLRQGGNHRKKSAKGRLVETQRKPHSVFTCIPLCLQLAHGWGGVRKDRSPGPGGGRRSSECGQEPGPAAAGDRSWSRGSCIQPEKWRCT